MFYRCEIFKNTYFEEHLRTAASELTFRKWLFWSLFLDSRFQNHPESVILKKYQSLSNQSSKHNSAQMLSLYLTTTLLFEPRFRMFIINGYNTKSKRL